MSCSVEKMQELMSLIIEDVDDPEIMKRCIRSVIAEIELSNGGPRCCQCICEEYGAYALDGPIEDVPLDIEDTITKDLCDYGNECYYKQAKMLVGSFSRPPYLWVDATLRDGQRRRAAKAEASEDTP